MKKSFLSISMLIVSISLLALFVCNSALEAKSSHAPQFIYNTVDNVETVYSLDDSGKLLTPVFKYEYQVEADGATSKTAYRWSANDQKWMPYYLLLKHETTSNVVLEYAEWNSKTGDYSANQQKTVYLIDYDDNTLSCTSLKWDNGTWLVSNQSNFVDYLASAE